jgi:hypothetical protein
MDTDRYTAENPEDVISGSQHFDPPDSEIEKDKCQLAGRSFGQLWGLHPGITLLVLVIDTMLFGAQVASLGALFPVALAVACVLGFITYRSQMRWYHDDSQSAAIKALIVALVTAIPSPLPAFLYVPAGLVGVVHTLRGKA